MKLSKAATIFSVVLFAAQHSAHAQTTFASITGIVTDASGSAVPNATVTAVNQQTNIRSSAKSNEAGNYTIAQLKEGPYSLQVVAPGFKEFVAADIALAARDERRVDAKLEVGS